MKKHRILFALFCLMASFALVACKPIVPTDDDSQDDSKQQDAMNDDSPISLRTIDQPIKDGTVIIPRVFAGAQGWVVIHSDNEGKPGNVIGYAPVGQGKSENVVVTIDEIEVTGKLYAMLHIDEGTEGLYEFPGADIPATYESNVVVAPFSILNAMADDGDAMEDVMEKDEGDQEGDAMMEDAMEHSSDEQVSNPDKETSNAPAVDITMVAKQWEFSPSKITVQKGTLVRMAIKSIDVDHGIAIPQFNVNEDLEAGSTTYFEFLADKSGTFTFSCNVFCGSGHGGMRGTLEVE